MKKFENYILKCLENKGYLIKTSIIAGILISFIFGLINYVLGGDINVIMVTFVISSVLFTLGWAAFVKGINRSFKNQARLVEEEKNREKQMKREKARARMEKKNKKR